MQTTQRTPGNAKPKGIVQIDDVAEQQRLQQEKDQRMKALKEKLGNNEEAPNPKVGGMVGEEATDAMKLMPKQGVAKVGAHGGRYKGGLREPAKSPEIKHKCILLDEVMFNEAIQIHSRSVNTISRESLVLNDLKIEFFPVIGMIRLSEPHWAYDYYHGLSNVKHMKAYKPDVDKTNDQKIRLDG